MDALTRTRLLKLLALTASSHDGEALAASRMANKLLKRTGASWADLFESSRDTAPVEATRANTEGYSQREESPRSESYGSDIFGEAPAWTPTLSERVIRAGRLRLVLARIPWPIRLLLGPLSTAGYLSAWTLEGDGSVSDLAARAMVAIVLSIAVAALWFEAALVLTGHWPI